MVSNFPIIYNKNAKLTRILWIFW